MTEQTYICNVQENEHAETPLPVQGYGNEQPEPSTSQPAVGHEHPPAPETSAVQNYLRQVATGAEHTEEPLPVPTY